MLCPQRARRAERARSHGRGTAAEGGRRERSPAGRSRQAAPRVGSRAAAATPSAWAHTRPSRCCPTLTLSASPSPSLHCIPTAGAHSFTPNKAVQFYPVMFSLGRTLPGVLYTCDFFSPQVLEITYLLALTNTKPLSYRLKPALILTQRRKHLPYLNMFLNSPIMRLACRTAHRQKAYRLVRKSWDVELLGLHLRRKKHKPPEA